MNFIVFRTQALDAIQFLEFNVNFYKPFFCAQNNIVFSDCWGCILYAHQIKLSNCVVHTFHICPNFYVLDILNTEKERERILKSLTSLWCSSRVFFIYIWKLCFSLPPGKLTFLLLSDCLYMVFALKSILSVTDTNNISVGFAYYLMNFRKKEMIPESSKM